MSDLDALTQRLMAMQVQLDQLLAVQRSLEQRVETVAAMISKNNEFLREILYTASPQERCTDDADASAYSGGAHGQ